MLCPFLAEEDVLISSQQTQTDTGFFKKQNNTRSHPEDRPEIGPDVAPRWGKGPVQVHRDGPSELRRIWSVVRMIIMTPGSRQDAAQHKQPASKT